MCDPDELKRAVEGVLDDVAPNKDSARVVSSHRVSGGCIHDAQVLELRDGRRFFVKSNRDPQDYFVAEAAGLLALKRVGAIRVPTLLGHARTQSGTGFLVLEFIETGRPGREFFNQFGRAMAVLHQRSEQARFGFLSDNYIGNTPQRNNWSSDWVEFWAVHRIGFQLELARKNRLISVDFSRRCEKLISHLDQLIGCPEERPVLIHGDLWSGNFMTSATGAPVLIDPAVYYGSREAEFGMTTLFGGFNTDFYDAYNECWPLTVGWEDRVEIYRFYHLLNHLNLFGLSYLEGCQTILNKYC